MCVRLSETLDRKWHVLFILAVVDSSDLKRFNFAYPFPPLLPTVSSLIPRAFNEWQWALRNVWTESQACDWILPKINIHRARLSLLIWRPAHRLRVEFIRGSHAGPINQFRHLPWRLEHPNIDAEMWRFSNTSTNNNFLHGKRRLKLCGAFESYPTRSQANRMNWKEI